MIFLKIGTLILLLVTFLTAVLSNILLVQSMIRSKKKLFSDNNHTSKRKAYVDLRFSIISSITISLIFMLYAFPRAIAAFLAIFYPSQLFLTLYVLLNFVFRFIAMFNFFGVTARNVMFREELKSLICYSRI